MVKLQLVQNEELYYQYIYYLRIHPLTKEGFMNQDEISIEDHNKFMDKHKEDYYICLCNGTPCGFVGSVDNDVRVCTDPSFQKKGIASFMLEKLRFMYPTATAQIKFDNLASIALFEKSDFKFELI
jgi:GNAT superfamily N-acetyltransferase